MPKNQIRIIGGEWRSRQIIFADLPGLRPTPNRVRETLFNWLQHDIPGSRCLDLYAGSGALGFEAASRGAKKVVQVENNPEACRALKETADKLNAKQISLIQKDVLHFLAEHKPEPYDIIFLDPPFGNDLAVQTCRLLDDNGWLSNHAKIYVEWESKNQSPETMPEHWQLLRNNTAGEVNSVLYMLALV